MRRAVRHAKRKKPGINNGAAANPDRLSELPELLLVHIISLLDMKDAVKTGVLSKKSKKLWTHVDSIVIEHEQENHEEETQNFVSFVDNILMPCNCPNIKKFNLCFFYDGPGKEIVLKWIQCVSRKNVEFLKLEVFNVGEIPECFYSNSSLVKLEIHSLTMGSLGSHLVRWTSLKSLYLFEVSTNDEQIAQIFLGSAMLETEILRRVWFVTRLDVISPSLKTLKLLEFEANKIYDPWKLLLLGFIN
ncbi:hypothetical protein BUALT_Bualt15G0109600 [Buddleja alternifolia]|uniref:F-box domain-containing protein n=1 Tax=Buddleja alternifolia TaxID=168488 RepID=A0AAV6WM10_9LAMI|nr:hypothetical protein BUALT_Bualt15G0109600 [Buddleja alternifolia]